MKCFLLFSLLLHLACGQENEKWWENLDPVANDGPTGTHAHENAGHHGEHGLGNAAESLDPRIDDHGGVSSHGEARSPISILPHEFCDGPGTKCVPYYNCDDLNVIVDVDGIPTINEQKGTNCSLYLEVCCRSISQDAIPPHSIFTDNICSGERNIYGLDARIPNLQSKETQMNEFPWMAAILRIESIGAKEINLYVCGGSIIGDDVILTAAHCVADQPPGKLKVRGGEWDTQQENEIISHQERYVREIHVHPGYNNESLWNNYAILLLDRKFQRNRAINTICLPSPHQVFENRTNCFATGWGKDKFGKEGQFQHILKKVELPYFPHQECQDALRKTRLTQYFILDESFLCAGGELGRDTCTGDGGSPLVCNLPGPGATSTYYQVGIVSWGIGCGEEGIPGVYADVRKGLEWIDSILVAPAHH